MLLIFWMKDIQTWNEQNTSFLRNSIDESVTRIKSGISKQKTSAMFI